MSNPIKKDQSQPLFKDGNGNIFYWKVRCLSVPLEPKQIDCIHCKGTGNTLKDDAFSLKDCVYCYGSGKKDLVINLYNTELEEYLQPFVEQYYKDIVKNNFLGEGI